LRLGAFFIREKVFLFTLYLFIQAVAMTAQLDYSSRKGSLSVERFATIHRDRAIVGYVSSVNLEHKKSTTKSISILDINADIIFQIEIENKPNYYLIETAFNGQQYAFLFLDVVTRSLELKLYNSNGKSGSRISADANQYGYRVFSSTCHT
jgi:hypothetical protein